MSHAIDAGRRESGMCTAFIDMCARAGLCRCTPTFAEFALNVEGLEPGVFLTVVTLPCSKLGVRPLGRQSFAVALLPTRLQSTFSKNAFGYKKSIILFVLEPASPGAKQRG